MIPSRVDILLVEDNPDHAKLIAEALADNSSRIERLHAVHDGEEALAFLRRQGEYSGAPRPQLVLLDLNLPKMDGREVLAEIKGDDDLRSIPVVVLTTSQSREDILQCYGLKANSYVMKPIGFDELVKFAKHIHSFWLETALLPRA